MSTLTLADLTIAYSKGRADEHAVMRTLIQRHYCTYGDTPGLIHCPIDKPCTTHQLERAKAALRMLWDDTTYGMLDDNPNIEPETRAAVKAALGDE